MIRFRKWTKIEDCPRNRIMLAILRLNGKIRLCRVRVHVDDHWLMWSQLRTLDGFGIGMWKCTGYAYFDLKKKIENEKQRAN